MRSFWITYTIVTLGLLVSCYSFVGALPLCAAVTAGAGASAVWLIQKRRTLSGQRHMISIAVLASVGSVAFGFIVIFMVVFVASIFR